MTEETQPFDEPTLPFSEDDEEMEFVSDKDEAEKEEKVETGKGEEKDEIEEKVETEGKVEKGEEETPTEKEDASDGDDDDDNGYILALDAEAAADTIYGDQQSDLGVYLTTSEVLTDETILFPNKGKLYVADKTLKLDLDTVPETPLIGDVYILMAKCQTSDP